jgi:hypothetical protein
MAITLTRHNDTDDDGSGTTGTIRNAAWKTQFYDDIDAALASLSTDGTWTPSLTFGGGAVGMTFSTRTGVYTKCGSIVIADFRITLTAKGSSTGAAVVTGLPYTVGSIGSSAAVDFPAAGASLTNPYALPNGTTILLCQTTASVRAQLTDANFTNTSDFRATVVYRV